MIYEADAAAMDTLDRLMMAGEKVSQEDGLRVVNHVLQDHSIMQPALDVVDTGRIVEFVTPKYGKQSNSRHVWWVPSKQGPNYICYETYCPCPAMLDLVLRNPSSRQVWCKHLTAIRIASAVQMSHTEHIKDKEYPAVTEGRHRAAPFAALYGSGSGSGSGGRGSWMQEAPVVQPAFNAGPGSSAMELGS